MEYIYHARKFKEVFDKQIAKYERKLTKANRRGDLQRKRDLEIEASFLILDRLTTLCQFEFVDLHGYVKYSFNYNENGKAEISTEFVELGFDGTTERHSRDEQWRKARTEAELKTNENVSVNFCILEGSLYYHNEKNLENYDFKDGEILEASFDDKKEGNKIHENADKENKTSVNNIERRL